MPKPPQPNFSCLTDPLWFLIYSFLILFLQSSTLHSSHPSAFLSHPFYFLAHVLTPCNTEGLTTNLYINIPYSLFSCHTAHHSLFQCKFYICILLGVPKFAWPRNWRILMKYIFSLFKKCSFNLNVVQSIYNYSHLITNVTYTITNYSQLQKGHSYFKFTTVFYFLNYYIQITLWRQLFIIKLLRQHHQQILVLPVNIHTCHCLILMSNTL